MSAKLSEKEEHLARDIYVALIGNPERYKYISELAGDDPMLTHDQLNEKNRNKAVKMARYFYDNINKD